MWQCSFAGGDTRHVICLHLSGAAEAPSAVGGKGRRSLLCQDFQPAAPPLRRLLHSKTLQLIVVGKQYAHVVTQSWVCAQINATPRSSRCSLSSDCSPIEKDTQTNLICLGLRPLGGCSLALGQLPVLC